MVVEPPIQVHQIMLCQFGQNPVILILALSILLIHQNFRIRSASMFDRLNRLRHHAVISRYHQNSQIGDPLRGRIVVKASWPEYR